MRKTDIPAKPKEESRKAPYDPPRIQSEKIFEIQSLVTCGKVFGDGGCQQEGFFNS